MSGTGFLSERAPSRRTAVEIARLAYACRVGARAAAPLVVFAILGAFTLAACGGGESTRKARNGAAGPPPSGPVGPAQRFPAAGGRTLAGLPRGPGPGPRLP